MASSRFTGVGSPRRASAAVLAGFLVLGAAAACGGSGSAGPESSGTPTSTQSSTGGQALPSGSAAQAVDGARWKPALNAEFDGTRLDEKIWRIGEPWQQPPGFDEGPDAYCPLPQGAQGPQVSVADGALHLTATADPDEPGGRLLSCAVSTRGTFSMTHGYVETRVKLPSGAGLWPSFWLLGNGTGAEGWPKTGEIDVFEFVNNGSSDGTPFFTTHWGGACPDGHCSISQLKPPMPTIRDYGTRWVTFGLLRTADTVTVYIDGKATASMHSGEKSVDGAPIGDVIFNAPMHIKMDLSAGGWATNPNEKSQPGDYAIDYVRAWA